MRRLYSKIVPGVYADFFTEPDETGKVAAVFYDPKDGDDPVPVPAVLLASEWSETELAPVPESVPVQAYLVLFGDPAYAEGYYVETEKQARKAVNEMDRAFGYVPIIVPRVMIPK